MDLGNEMAMPLTVLAMVAGTLVMAAIVRQHQQHRARIGIAIRRYDAGAREIDAALTRLREVPLSPELRTVFRGEIYARYRRIQRLFRGYPGIRQRVLDAESQVGAQGPSASGGVGPVESDGALRELLAAIDTLASFLKGSGLVQTVPADVRQVLCRELGERRAEITARYHLVHARLREQESDLTRARGHLTTLMQTLRSRGPSTEFVRSLYHEAEEALQRMTERQLDDVSGDGEKASGAAG
jgi:hypothetical protein